MLPLHKTQTYANSIIYGAPLPAYVAHKPIYALTSTSPTILYVNGLHLGTAIWSDEVDILCFRSGFPHAGPPEAASYEHIPAVTWITHSSLIENILLMSTNELYKIK